MIDQVSFLYKEGAIDSSIQDAFFETFENIFMCLELSGVEFDVTDEPFVKRLETDTYEIEFIYDNQDIKLKQIFIVHDKIWVNEDCEEDFLISLEILKGVVSVA